MRSFCVALWVGILIWICSYPESREHVFPNFNPIRDAVNLSSREEEALCTLHESLSLLEIEEESSSSSSYKTVASDLSDSYKTVGSSLSDSDLSISSSSSDENLMYYPPELARLFAFAVGGIMLAMLVASKVVIQ